MIEEIRAYAIEKVPPVEWGRRLMELFPKCYKYVEDQKRNWDKYQNGLKYFENTWRDYLMLRQIADPGQNEAVFPGPIFY
jgi:hypothetical protein